MAAVAEIVAQLDFYFKPQNIVLDIYLFQQVSSELDVSLRTIKHFPKSQHLIKAHGEAAFDEAVSACAFIESSPKNPLFVTLKPAGPLICLPIIVINCSEFQKLSPTDLLDRINTLVEKRRVFSSVKLCSLSIICHVDEAASGQSTLDELCAKIDELISANENVKVFKKAPRSVSTESLKDAFFRTVLKTHGISPETVKEAFDKFIARQAEADTRARKRDLENQVKHVAERKARADVLRGESGYTQQSSNVYPLQAVQDYIKAAITRLSDDHASYLQECNARLGLQALKNDPNYAAFLTVDSLTTVLASDVPYNDLARHQDVTRRPHGRASDRHAADSETPQSERKTPVKGGSADKTSPQDAVNRAQTVDASSVVIRTRKQRKPCGTQEAAKSPPIDDPAKESAPVAE